MQRHFLLLLLTLFVGCCPEPTELTPDPANIPECASNTGFPKIPGWKHESITVPSSHNRGWKPYFLNENQGFLYGSDGQLRQTTDGGYTWQTAGNWPELSFNHLFFPDEKNGFAATLDRSVPNSNLIEGALLKTTDGGLSWTKHSYTPSGLLHHLYFLDAQRGFAEFSQYYLNSSNPSVRYLARTTDGGATWTPVPEVVPSTSINNALRIFPNGFGYLGGDEGKVYVTQDFGENWQVLETSLDRINRVQFLDPLHGFACNFEKLIRTTDGGNTWTTISEKPVSFFYFFSPEEGLSLQTVGTYSHGDYADYCTAFLSTKDGGATWLESEASFNFGLGAVFFLNDRLGFSSRDFFPGTFVRLERE